MSYDDMHFDIVISGIFGKHGTLGEGKTALATRFALIQKEMYPKQKQYSNYKLPFTETIDNINDLQNLRNCYVTYDDIIPSFDSRQSQINVLETWILNTCRKYGIHLTYTAQFEEGVEFRLRRISDFIFEIAQLDFPDFHVRVFKTLGVDVTKIDEFDFTMGKDIADIYNTLEVVSRKVNLKDLRNEVEEFDKKRSFQSIARVTHGFSYDLAGIVYDLVRFEKIDTLKKLLEGHGFKIV